MFIVYVLFMSYIVHLEVLLTLYKSPHAATKVRKHIRDINI